MADTYRILVAGMTPDPGPDGSPRRFGETTGPILVWLFVLVWFSGGILVTGSAGSTLPQDLTVSLALQLVEGILLGWVPILLVLVLFVRWREGKKSLRDVFSALGFKKEGAGKSLFWIAVLLPAFAAVYFVSMGALSLVSPGSAPPASPATEGAFPRWYLVYLILYSLFPVAIIEEALGRGYLLDRLMPEHPCGVARAMPAILLSSLMFTAYHLPAYLLMYAHSNLQAMVLLATNVLPFSILLSVAYVRARARNISGPVFLHFLLDAGAPIILLLAA